MHLPNTHRPNVHRPSSPGTAPDRPGLAHRTRHRPGRTLAALAAAALTLAACGTAEPSSTAAPSAATEGGRTAASATGAASGVSPLPAVDVIDVATGAPVPLAGLLPAARPTLLWMWAPS